MLTGNDATYHLPGNLFLPVVLFCLFANMTVVGVGARQPDTCFVGWNVPFPGPGGVGAANPQGSAWPTVTLC